MTCPVIMITGNPNIETATEAVRLGAHDYIFKSIKIETLTRKTAIALQYKSVVEERNRYQSNLEAIFRSGGFEFSTRKYGNYSILPSKNYFGVAISLSCQKVSFGWRL